MTMPPFVTSKPRFETITYIPGLKNTTDLEAATKTISATSEASGTGNADYSSAQTMAIPTDTRLLIKMITSRLSVTIDSDDGTHDLKCRVYVDAQDADHLLFDLTYAATGNQLSVQDCNASTKAVIFALLKDGAAHTLYFFFWSPGNHSPVISVVQLWFGVGSSGTASGEVMRLTHKGHAHFTSSSAVTGTGTRNQKLVYTGGASNSAFYYYITPDTTGIMQSSEIVSDPTLATYGSVATDIVTIARVGITLRCE